MPEIKNTRNFRIEDSIWEAAKEAADAEGVRVSDYLRAALIEAARRHKETNQ